MSGIITDVPSATLSLRFQPITFNKKTIVYRKLLNVSTLLVQEYFRTGFGTLSISIITVVNTREGFETR